MKRKKAKQAHDHDAKLSGKLGRRAFMTLCLNRGLATVGFFGSMASIFGVSLPDIINSEEESEKKLREEERAAILQQEERLRHEEQLTILRELFGFDGKKASLVPAADHPFKPPADHYWYPVDGACALAYKRALYPDLALAQVNSVALDADPQDSLVMFGSQVSNAEVRSIFGNPWMESEPHFSIIPGTLGSGWQANLRWNLYCSDSMKRKKPIEILVPGIAEIWKEDERVILDAKNNQPYAAIRNPLMILDTEVVDSLVEDFLLVTVLPRHWNVNGQKIISFAGLYGPGMEAAELLFSANEGELRRLQEATEREPFYQALYRVFVKTNDKGQMVPQSLQLEGAAPLYQTLKKGGDVILSTR